MSELVEVRRACMALQARREHSRYELAQKLARRECYEAHIQSVLDEFQAKNLQSDERFCEAYLRMRLKQGFGPLKIRLELEQKRVDSELIERYLSAYADEFDESLQVVFAKKFGEPAQDLKEKAKQLRFLSSRGFDFEHVRYLIK